MPKKKRGRAEKIYEKKNKKTDDKYVIIRPSTRKEGWKGGEEGRKGGESVIDGLNGGREGGEIC